MLSAPSISHAGTFEYLEVDGQVQKDIVIIDGETFILSTEEEIRMAVKNSVELKASKAQVDLLLGKISLLEGRLKYSDEIQEMYRTELQYNYDYIEKTRELNDVPFYQKFESGLFVGALTMTLTFFLWEFGRNQ